MTSMWTGRVVREAVGVFHSADDLQAAIDELLTSGFDRADLSLLAGQEAVDRKLGPPYRKVAELEDDRRVPRAAYVSVESLGDAKGGLIGGLGYVGAVTAAGAIVASGGTIAGAILGAAVAGWAGGMVGSALARWVGHRQAVRLQEQLDHGGLLLWVQVRDAEHEARAVRILNDHAAADVHVHGLPEAAG